ncbi:CBS domain-containing protein [Chitinispirillales bacterium ANBcel5]|uniref:CBS domain-containing protein n=1 Tax=Cellulosispirillum alkaliphilum TaxID=3039283 RepID=UPI002A582BC3|nr:CBS domain-containing protein [Chitinispirillales bacterium ANBcel5]
MKVNEIMTKGVEGIKTTDTILHACQRMRDLDIGAIPVFDQDNVIGVVTDRDVAVRVIAEQLNPAHTSVGEVMSKDAKTCAEDTEVEEAARVMENYKIRRLFVTDSTGALTGIVSLGDLAAKGGKEISAEILSEISQPIGPHR